MKRQKVRSNFGTKEAKIIQGIRVCNAHWAAITSLNILDKLSLWVLGIHAAVGFENPVDHGPEVPEKNRE